MTDNEIIKSMQCVIGNDVSCSECTYQKVLPYPSCRMMCAKNALALINRQQTEIERLKMECYKLYPKGSAYSMQVEASDRLEHQIKSEAIKEFAERLCNDRVSNDPVVIAVNIELKEIENNYFNGVCNMIKKNIVNAIKEIEDLLKESEQNSDGAAAGFDEGFFSGECNAYSNVLNILEKVKQ